MPEWFTHERRNWIALTFVAAFGGFFLGNGHTTQNAVQAIAQKEGQDRATIHVLKTQLHPTNTKTDQPRHKLPPIE